MDTVDDQSTINNTRLEAVSASVDFRYRLISGLASEDRWNPEVIFGYYNYYAASPATAVES